jgi:hypothetical protein
MKKFTLIAFQAVQREANINKDKFLSWEEELIWQHKEQKSRKK